MLNDAEIQKLSDNYMGGTKIKHLTYFEEDTPDGNRITGYINQKPNKYLGSLIILTVNNEECIQFIQSMPKIHYPIHETDISKTIINPCYEKLDGTCLILYPLKNKENEIIEIIPKTRGRAVADQHFIELYHKVDQKIIKDYYQNNDGILIFELYGILNQHNIIHYNTGIDIKLIGIYANGDFINEALYIDEYNFTLPDKICEIYYKNNHWILEFTTKKYKQYLPHVKYHYTTLQELINNLKEKLETLNHEYSEYNNRPALEGVVINTHREDGSLKWLKCKPHSIEHAHRAEAGIPKNTIRKEVYKYFDEYGSQVEEIYKKHPEHHTEYLYRMLSEEYDELYINKSKNKIEKTFMEVWKAREVPENLHDIAKKIYETYGVNGTITDCMRIFAQEYPMLKKDSRLIYSVLTKYY